MCNKRSICLSLLFLCAITAIASAFPIRYSVLSTSQNSVDIKYAIDTSVSVATVQQQSAIVAFSTLQNASLTVKVSGKTATGSFVDIPVSILSKGNAGTSFLQWISFTPWIKNTGTVYRTGTMSITFSSVKILQSAKPFFQNNILHITFTNGLEKTVRRIQFSVSSIRVWTKNDD